jgi:hypothetical protein
MNDSLDRLLENAKTAGVASDFVRKAFEAGKQMAQANRPEIIGALVGGALATGLGAATVKRWGGKPSLQELDAAQMRAAQKAEGQKLREKGKKPGFSHKVQDAVAGAYAGVSKAMAEHPVAGSLTYGATGARLGIDLARLAREWSK